MTIQAATQAALEKVVYAHAVHVREVHSGELPQSCSTCVALSAAVAACRVAAMEGTELPAKSAQRRRRTCKRRSCPHIPHPVN